MHVFLCVQKRNVGAMTRVSDRNLCGQYMRSFSFESIRMNHGHKQEKEEQVSIQVNAPMYLPCICSSRFSLTLTLSHCLCGVLLILPMVYHPPAPQRCLFSAVFALADTIDRIPSIANIERASLSQGTKMHPFSQQPH